MPFASVFACLLLSLLAMPASGQTLYKYKDEQGNWHFTDRKPADLDGVESSELTPPQYSFEVILETIEEDGRVTLYATNEFYAPVELRLERLAARNLTTEPPETHDTVLPPRSRTELVAAEIAQGRGRAQMQYAAAYIIGDPNARHVPDTPYRVPYASGQSHPVSQAFPGGFTHTTPNNQHAVDIAMPEGTGIYAARGGTVVTVAYDSYSGGTKTGPKAPKANLVRILHADGTMAVYAHLQWESVRIRPGDKVERGEYIARSGNTGFSTGPHLHFAVELNTGLQLTAVPVTFMGPGGAAVSPKSRRPLTAY